MEGGDGPKLVKFYQQKRLKAPPGMRSSTTSSTSRCSTTTRWARTTGWVGWRLTWGSWVERWTLVEFYIFGQFCIVRFDALGLPYSLTSAILFLRWATTFGGRSRRARASSMWSSPSAEPQRFLNGNKFFCKFLNVQANSPSNLANWNPHPKWEQDLEERYVSPIVKNKQIIALSDKNSLETGQHLLQDEGYRPPGGQSDQSPRAQLGRHWGQEWSICSPGGGEYFSCSYPRSKNIFSSSDPRSKNIFSCSDPRYDLSRWWITEWPPTLSTRPWRRFGRKFSLCKSTEDQMTLFPSSDVQDIHDVLEVTVYDEDKDHKYEFLGKVDIILRTFFLLGKVDIILRTSFLHPPPLR